MFDGLLDDARTGRSGALVVRGDAGVGKTALLDYAIASASDLAVVQVVGVESEMELAFAALHQLCVPILDRLERLPGPQRGALEVTFGLSDGPVPDRFLVGLAALGLLAEAAEQRALVCVVDDAQWLDTASAQALAFVARRLLAESVVLLFAARQPSDELVGLPELRVGGLQEADTRELLRSVVPGRLDERVREQVMAETRGNPLAVLELTRGLSPSQLAGGFGLPAAMSLERQIEESFRARLQALPVDTRRVLLAAAAEPSGDPGLMWRAAKRLGIAAQSLDPAVDAGLVEVGVRVRFRHPLARSAVYRSASPEERREVHRALAETTDARVDPDRRAWHLAEASEGPDEEIADELERSAERAQARGGLAAAGTFLDRAAAFTVDSSRRVERTLAASQTKYEAGLLDDALALLSAIEAQDLDEVHRARVELLRAQIAFAARRGSDAPPMLLSAARELEAVDPDLARATYLEAIAATLFAGRLARGVDVAELGQAALDGVPQSAARRPTDLLLRGLAIRCSQGAAAAASTLKEALAAFRGTATLTPREARWLWLASWVASDMWDDEAWRVLSTRLLESARDAGALTAIPLALGTRSMAYAQSGDLASVAAMVDEVHAVTEATGIATVPYGPLWLYALQGLEAELSALIQTTLSQANVRGEGVAIAMTEYVSAILYNGMGRYEEALAAIRHLGEQRYDVGSPARAAAERIEAAVRLEQAEVAGEALKRLAESTRATGTDWALGVEVRSRALLSEGEVAEGLYREAITRLGRTRVRVELARAHLLYGEWLRRTNRRVDAREQLRIADTMFSEMGVGAFAERTKRELSATGERVRKRTVETREDLTTQEAQVARLAREGVSNAEIAERLFISRSTVEYHLHKVFNKLGISSRHQLEHALPSEPSGAART